MIDSRDSQADSRTVSEAAAGIWRRRTWLLLLVPSLCVAASLGFYRYHLKRFQAVAPGVFYRVGQPTEIGFHVLEKLYGARTVVSLQLFDFRLKAGLLDLVHSDGRKEAEFVESLGMRHVQWTMGDEQCWPWPEPWQLEAFYELFDNPANHPVVVHCMGGRHRTGTISALYRMEYDRCSPAEALREMYTFSFGGAIPIQEHNLLTYTSRPEPDAVQWKSLRESLVTTGKDTADVDFRTLVRRLRATRTDASVQAALVSYIERREPFALPLAARLIDAPDGHLSGVATNAAIAELKQQSAAVACDSAAVSAAATLVADFGSPAEQEFLAGQIRAEVGALREPSPYYEALVRGLMSRFTRNRPAFLQPLVDDVRLRPGVSASRYRYCESLLYFITSTTDEIPCMMWTREMVCRTRPRRRSAMVCGASG
ncbi:MAG: tyrosine-protein phosphatase [Pirellulales bacterium]